MQNIKLQVLMNPEEIISYLKTNDIYKGIFNEESLPDTWKPDTLNILWLLVLENDKPCGLLILHKIDNEHMGFHGGVFYKGTKWAQALNFCLDLFRPIFNCKFITTVNETNKPAICLLLRAGFKEHSRIKNFYKTTDAVVFSE